MPNINLTIDQLCSAIEDLNAEEFLLVDQRLDRRRRERLKEIVQKARQNATRVTPEEEKRIIQDAVSEVRAENAANGRS